MAPDRMMRLPPDIATPALVVDRARLERNLKGMADRAAARGIRLRPHAKTHKTAEIGRLQLEMGAVGLTVATISEAEKFADAGVTDLFIAYPLWPSRQRLARLAALAERVSLRLGIESADAAARLGSLAVLASPPEILVEIDSGHHRTGVPPGGAGEVALAAAHAGLPLAGVFTFPGHSYAPGRREPAARDEAAALAAASSALAVAGAADGERSGGSTPTAAVPADPPPTELRPGVYVFNDAQQAELGVCGDDQIALAAAATVVSRRARDRFVLDSGSKVLGADAASWSTGFGRLLGWPGARIVAVSEHHATVVLPPGSPELVLGETVAAVPNHVCAAVNLADELLVIGDAEVIGTWRVMARGANT
jgi:D-serine deaminase-like pyridoxal phosphate-dependent protein